MGKGMVITGALEAAMCLSYFFNTALAEEKDSPVAKEVQAPQQAVALLLSTKGNDVQGVIGFSQTSAGVRVTGTVRGLSPGLHGFHIHEFGDLTSSDGKSAGGHFNPTGVKHGGPEDKERHAGDLGNIEAGKDGTAKVDKLAKGLKLHFVLGRSIVVHAGADDLKSQPSGDAGDRVALGVIGIAQAKKSAAER